MSPKATLTGLVLVLALALPAAASAQLDPTLDQYAPSTQQIHHQVGGHGGGGGGHGGGGGGGGGDGGQTSPSGGGGGQVAPDGGGGQVPQGGDGGQGQQSGDDGRGQQGGGARNPAGSDQADSGLSARVVDSVPLTGFDLIALALVAAAIAGTAVLLRRQSRRPEPEA